MSDILYVVSVVDLDLVCPSKIYEGVGPHFELLYDSAFEAVLKARKRIRREVLKNHFQENAQTMKTIGGFMFAHRDNEIEIYSSIYKVSTSISKVSSKKRRVDVTPPYSPKQTAD